MAKDWTQDELMHQLINENYELGEKHQKACDEIERLREALRHIAKLGPDGEPWNTKPEMWGIAMNTLQQKGEE